MKDAVLMREGSISLWTISSEVLSFLCLSLSVSSFSQACIPITAADLMIFSISQQQKDMKRQSKRCFICCDGYGLRDV